MPKKASAGLRAACTAVSSLGLTSTATAYFPTPTVAVKGVTPTFRPSRNTLAPGIADCTVSVPAIGSSVIISPLL